MPGDQVALRYRVEQRDKDTGEWEPVKAGKSFKKNQQIRFRFMSNVSGTLHVLNGSEGANLKPIFDDASGAGRWQFLGLGTRIDAHRVGLWPRPDQGSAIRFTGYSGKEQFLIVYVPDTLGGSREVMAVPPGAEDWDFEANTTFMITADPQDPLFHYFTMKSKQ